MFAAGTKPAGVAVSPAAPGSAGLWRKVVEPVEPFLKAVARRLAEQVDSFDPEIVAYARYALTNQGKQLRPALVALSAGAVGKPSDSLVTAAVIIEMVHLATLVHDDIMDEAAVRRRRPTLAANWGNQISVLLGDCLFAHALTLASGFPTTEVCRAVAAATKTVCSGEILQTHRQRQSAFSRAEYFRILQMKTGELFALSCDLGARLGGAGAQQRAALRQFGLQLGTAYQIYDDCLDIFGSEANAGKSLGTDLAGGKLTLPVLIVLERALPSEASRLRRLIENWEGRHIQLVLDLLENHNALDDSRLVICQYLESARKCLRDLPASRSLEALLEVTEFLAKQTDDLGVRLPA
jgi:octaprenyl-diphosphate synthase